MLSVTRRSRRNGPSLLRGLFLAALLGFGPAAFGQATISQSLQNELAGLSLFETTTVIVTFDQTTPLGQAQRSLVASTGVTRGFFFEALPIAAVLATPAQAALLANLPGVLSLWANEPLEYFNEGGTSVTGVDRLRADPNLRNGNGLPFTGEGVTVVVNDSGIDATHGDLEFGTHVVENVQAVTNLNAVSGLLPVTYIEGTPNTDLNSGHGTHCAGTVGGTGVMSDGLYEGVAPGADLIGYGSGAVILILDGLGGFDYAISRQNDFAHPIRVITNSWGSSGSDFDPEDPISLASYSAYKAGINVLFAAGNAGSGEDTHNPYAWAPWVISVGAGTKAGNLADFSSRGLEGRSFSFTTPDGVSWTARNEVSITAPGVNIISARAATNGGANGGADDADFIAPEHLPFYTMISGTSMATPHVAGIVALLLEANPSLTPDQVRETLRKTATNMPGRETWESGTGYVNAYAAVAAAAGDTRYTGTLLNSRRSFNANAQVSVADETDFSIMFTPVGQTEEQTFEVGADISVVSARATVEDNLVAVVLIDPDGVRYGSAISIPVLGGTVAVTAPGKPGTWTLTVSGIGSVSGIGTDPLGLTNGTSLPGTVNGTLKLVRLDGFTGLGDISGHPDEAFIGYAVSNRLVDGLANGTFAPNAALRRHQLAQYLVMGAGVRQFFPTDGGYSYYLRGNAAALAEAVTAQGAPLKDGAQAGAGVMRVQGGVSSVVTRAALAYSLVQALGLDAFAADYAGVPGVDVGGVRVPLEDAGAIPAAFRGHVQLALELQLMQARIETAGGTLRAFFDPAAAVSRGHYAEVKTRFFETYFNGFELPAEDRGASITTTALSAQSGAGSAPAVFSLDANYPNPFASNTTISYSLPEATAVRLTVYNVAGQKVAELASGTQEAGRHEVQWDAGDLASGVYLYRLQAGPHTATQRMMLVK